MFVVAPIEVGCSSDDECAITRGDGVSMLVQVSHGLSYINYARVVHLDIKPENVISFTEVGSPPTLQLADFGQSMKGPREDGALHLSTRR